MGMATRLERPQRVYARRPKKIWERYAVRDVMRNEVMRHICGEPPDSTPLPSSPHYDLLAGRGRDVPSRGSIGRRGSRGDLGFGAR